MSESYYKKAPSEQIITVRFWTRASFDQVVVHLLEAARETDYSLLTVFGDGQRMYPLEGRNPARRASLWLAEFSWDSPALMSGRVLEVILKRAELLLGLPGGVRLVLSGGSGNPREDGGGGTRARVGEATAEIQTLLDQQS